MLELVGLASDVDAAVALGERLGGAVYGAHASESEARPYSVMIRVVTDDIESVRRFCDRGLYVAFSRVIKPLDGAPPPDRVVATFGLVRHPELTHGEADAHWRDVHGPVALRCHTAMCDYTQLSILDTIDGSPLDGIAMCAFETRSDLSTRFFNDDVAKAEVIADVSTFADPASSPPRVVLRQLV